MEPELNPYSPGSGVAPRVLAGRDADIAAFDTLIARTKLSLHARPIVLSGLRGVGKTVLLNRLRGMAEHHGWLTIQFEARPGAHGAKAARQALANGLAKNSLRYKTRAATKQVGQMLATVSSFNAALGVTGFSFGVERDLGRASAGVLEMDLQDVVEDMALAIRPDHKALVVFIDEMQDLDHDLLEALVTVQHAAGQRELPFFVIGAGLPNLPARLADVRSYAERLFEYRTIGRLPAEDARESMEGPAKQMGQSYEPAALEILLQESGRYPYFIQEFGSAMWTVATASPFSMSNARAAGELGRARLDSGFFPSRWDRATPAERQYLSAMAVDGDGPSTSGDIATRLGKKIQSLGPTRSTLISKGLVYSPEHGKIAFTVPGMATYINRQQDQLPG
ncbi:MAG TPA: ATP-binding protein [Arthrobacter sp.]|nr:ATP-binding protein [Arthrobacter sp.]